MNELQGEDARKKVGALLKSFSTGMLVTHTAGGVMHARPMGLHRNEAAFDGNVWFFSGRNSRKVSELKNGRVSLVLQNDDKHAYLHLRGNAIIQDDRAKIEELWSAIYKAWFPAGIDDPNLALIHFVAEDGEYWESDGGFLVTLAGFASAIVTGTQADVGEAGTVNLR